MSATTIEAGDFAVGRCAECRREVVTYLAEGISGEPDVRRCIHCDERLRGDPRWIDTADLEALGYEVDSGEEGGGCTSCTSGGCGVRLINEKRGMQ